MPEGILPSSPKVGQKRPLAPQSSPREIFKNVPSGKTPPIQPKIEVKSEPIECSPEIVLMRKEGSRRTIPGSLRMRPEAGRKQILRPDWAAPCTGITTVTDHRRKFKINQVKTIKLVKDGKGKIL